MNFPECKSNILDQPLSFGLFILQSWILPDKREKKEKKKRIRQRKSTRRYIEGVTEAKRIEKMSGFIYKADREREREEYMKRKSGWSFTLLHTLMLVRTLLGPRVSFSKEYTVNGLCHTRHACSSPFSRVLHSHVHPFPTSSFSPF